MELIKSLLFLVIDVAKLSKAFLGLNVIKSPDKNNLQLVSPKQQCVD
nr:MAG TPA: Multidrug efflux pump subunit AcrB transporter, Multidrug efflux pump [Caudoviricetes sp.]